MKSIAASEVPSSRRESRSATIRVFIVDDHPIVREGLKQIATSDPEIRPSIGSWGRSTRADCRRRIRRRIAAIRLR